MRAHDAAAHEEDGAEHLAADAHRLAGRDEVVVVQADDLDRLPNQVGAVPRPLRQQRVIGYLPRRW